MSYEITHRNIEEKVELPSDLKKTEDYSKILDYYNLESRNYDFYLQVGDITITQGWILHVSSVKSQFQLLLELIIPVLTKESVSFRIVPNEESLWNLLSGSLGIERIGKAVSIYPETPHIALRLAKELIPLTQGLKGPLVYTDRHLGGNVYTRFGSHNPMIMNDHMGIPHRYILNPSGEIITDDYQIPFALPPGIEWPFSELVSFESSPTRKKLQKRYKPISYLKSDARGNVYTALYLKNLFNLKWCVIKEGIKDMWSDHEGRDISDRLAWQYDLHKKLERIVPLPRALDFFTENGDTYLVTEFIKGASLTGRAIELNASCYAWNKLRKTSKLQILNYIQQIVDILDKLHKSGVVHRDITVDNFLSDKHNKLFLIDSELAFSLTENKPFPPYELGTYGFMSPEQRERQRPTIKEDIYGLGACMVLLFTGVSPLAFDVKYPNKLFKNLLFMIGQKEIAAVISTCLCIDPNLRPAIQDIKEEITRYQQQIIVGEERQDNSPLVNTPDTNELKLIIQRAINGLSHPPTILANELWYSKEGDNNSPSKNEQTGYAIKYGIDAGMSGILYFLGNAHKAGFEIKGCIQGYYKGLEMLQDQYFQSFPNAFPGLNNGAAGAALAIATGLNAGLLTDNDRNRSFLRSCFDLSPTGLDVDSGMSGQGIALIACRNYLEESFFENTLERYVQGIKSAQKNNGLWIIPESKEVRHANRLAYSSGDAGIMLFLLQYLSITNDPRALNMIEKGFHGINKAIIICKKLLKTEGYRKLSFANPGLIKGIYIEILICLRMYGIVGDPLYKSLGEQLLTEFPKMIVQDNFSEDSGLAGLGEIYLDAYGTFSDTEWLNRANWIVQFFMHTYHQEDEDYYYWVGNNSRFPTADFLLGNSGIIYFLMRYLNQDGLKYRVWG